MRERGLDSRPWIKRLQNGAEDMRKGRTTRAWCKTNKLWETTHKTSVSGFFCRSAKMRHFILELWHRCREYTFSKHLTGVIVMFQICVLSAVFSQEGLDVVVFVPVEWWDALTAKLWVAAHTLWKSTKAFPGQRRTIRCRQLPKSCAHLYEAGERGELKEERSNSKGGEEKKK